MKLPFVTSASSPTQTDDDKRRLQGVGILVCDKAPELLQPDQVRSDAVAGTQNHIKMDILTRPAAQGKGFAALSGKIVAIRCGWGGVCKDVIFTTTL